MNLKEKLNKIINNVILQVLKEHDANNLFVQDFVKNTQKIKKLVTQYTNIVDPSFDEVRKKELKIDLVNMFIRSLDANSQLKYKNLNDVNLLKIVDGILNFSKKSSQQPAKSGVFPKL